MIDWKLAKANPPKEDGTYLTTMDGELVGQWEPFVSMCGFYGGEWDEHECVIAWDFMPEPFGCEAKGEVVAHLPMPARSDAPVRYWPMAITENGDRLFTYESVRHKKDALRQFEIWTTIGYKIKTAWIDCANGKRINIERTWAESSPEENANEQ